MADDMFGLADIGKERAPDISTIDRNGVKAAMAGNCAAAAGIKAENVNDMSMIATIVATTDAMMMADAIIIARLDKPKREIANSK